LQSTDVDVAEQSVNCLANFGFPVPLAAKLGARSGDRGAETSVLAQPVPRPTAATSERIIVRLIPLLLVGGVHIAADVTLFAGARATRAGGAAAKHIPWTASNLGNRSPKQMSIAV